MAKKKKAAKPPKMKKPKKAAKPARAAKKPKTWKSDRAKRALKNVPRTPRERPLPGMEDARIQALEDIGVMYADIRDQRVALSGEEQSLKEQAKKLMHKHGKTVYRSKTIEILLTEASEDIKVKVRKEADQDALAERSQAREKEISDRKWAEGRETTEDPDEALETVEV